MTDTFDAFIDSLIETDVADMAAAKNKPDHRVKFPCGQCAGTGRYQGARVHQEKSHCFACRGKGYFLSSPEKRQQSRDAARQRARGTVEKGVAARTQVHSPKGLSRMRPNNRCFRTYNTRLENRMR